MKLRLMGQPMQSDTKIAVQTEFDTPRNQTRRPIATQITLVYKSEFQGLLIVSKLSGGDKLSMKT